MHADTGRRLLVIEHYRNDGLLTAILEAGDATDGYTSVLAAGLVSRLDHAAYLGRELTRAEHALRTGTPTGKTQHLDRPGSNLTQTGAIASLPRSRRRHRRQPRSGRQAIHRSRTATRPARPARTLRHPARGGQVQPVRPQVTMAR